MVQAPKLSQFHKKGNFRCAKVMVISMKTKEKFRLDRAAFMTEPGWKTQLNTICGDAAAWKSADASVAVVDGNGMVTAVGNGDTVITAEAVDGRTASCTVSVGYHGQNPLLPPTWGLFIADGEPHVFDGRMYIYGSRDNAMGVNEAGCPEFCSGDYHVIYSDDLLHWTDAGVSISIDDFPEDMRFSEPTEAELAEAQKQGKTAAPKRIDYLWAPDLFKSPREEKYYLTFCSGEGHGEYFIAESDSPTGPFDNIRYLTDHGTRMRGIDPGVLVDDDGRVYIALPKPFRIGELDPDRDYAEIKEGTTVYVQDLVAESPDGHYGFEGPSLRKFNGLYYFIYIASELGQWRPVRMNYLVSENMHEGWRFCGTIIDTYDYLDGSNVHGSIAQFGDQLYLAYHRMCPGVPTHFMREMHMEPITIDGDGHFVPVVMTSSGVRGSFAVGETIPASTAVMFSGGRGDLRFMHRGTEEPSGSNHWYFPKYPYAWFDTAGQYNGYRYVELEKAHSVEFCIRTTAPGAVLLLRNYDNAAVLARVPLSDTNGAWTTVSCTLTEGLTGKFTVIVELVSAPTSGRVDFDWFRCT